MDFEKLKNVVSKVFEVAENLLTGQIPALPYEQEVKIRNARCALVYCLRESGLSYGNIQKLILYNSRGGIADMYKQAKGFLESNTYHFQEKIKEIQEHLQTYKPMELTSQPQEPEIKANAEPQTETPTPLDVSESPLSEPVIERDTTQILRPEPEKIKNESLLDELEQLEAFEQELKAQDPKAQTIPEMSFEPAPTGDKMNVKVDEETIDFSAESVLNIVEFVSVELTCYYSQLSEQDKRLQERTDPFSQQRSKEYSQVKKYVRDAY
jgi:hypothetical protein